MVRTYVALAFLLVTLRPAIARAQMQDTCTQLVQNAVYDHFKEESGQHSDSDVRTNVCSAYQRLLSDRVGAHVQAVYEVFAGEAGYSSDKLEAIAQSMCTGTYDQAHFNQSYSTLRTTLNPAAIDVVRDCLNLAANQLQVRTDVGENASTVVIDARYAPPAGTTATQTVAAIQISPPNAFTCAGPLWDARNGKSLTNVAIGMQCTRSIAAIATLVSGKYALAPESRITIFTSAGAITRLFGIVPPPPRPGDDPPVPIGTVIAYAGEVTQPPDGWLVCDGRPLPQGGRNSRLFAVLGYSHGGDPSKRSFNLPDYRGRFLRGTDAGANREEKADRDKRQPMNPGGNAGDKVGTVEDDALAAHSHPIPFRFSGGSNHDGVPWIQAGEPTYPKPDKFEVGTSGGTETRPKNAAVYYLIRAW